MKHISKVKHIQRFRRSIFAKFLLLAILALLLYFITLCFPQPAFQYSLTVGNITAYSDRQFDTEKMTSILNQVEQNITKSAIYNPEQKHRVYIANDSIRWTYFTNFNSKAGGINYVMFNGSIFLRTSNIDSNRLIGPSGNEVPGDRTLSYFISHEITHSLEYNVLGVTRYPFQTNWVLEGYCDYVAHGSKSYEYYLDQYLNLPETTSAKYYTRARTMVAYLLEKKSVSLSEIWGMTDRYDEILKLAIPNDYPKIEGANSLW